jgi:hypothetical protein
MICGILIRQGKMSGVARENEKVHFGRGSRLTFSSRVLFHRHHHYYRCLPTLFRILAALRPLPAFLGGTRERATVKRSRVRE